jgi:hypothetical protein
VCSVRARPSDIDPLPANELDAILPSVRTWIDEPVGYSREDLIAEWGRDYALHLLPRDFAGARSEAVVHGPGFLAVGEYGMPGKRLVIATRAGCRVIDRYVRDQNVLHIHALGYAAGSQELLVSTGDAAKILDSWQIRSDSASPKCRLRPRLAGYTAILATEMGTYLGTDFSSRPNYIETLDGARYYFPRLAFTSYVVKFTLRGRHLLSLSALMSEFGGRSTVSIFDTAARRFVFCDDVDVLRNGKERAGQH